MENGHLVTYVMFEYENTILPFQIKTQHFIFNLLYRVRCTCEYHDPKILWITSDLQSYTMHVVVLINIQFFPYSLLAVRSLLAILQSYTIQWAITNSQILESIALLLMIAS